MKSIRVQLGVLGLCLLILSPKPVSTRTADQWAVGDLFVGVGTDRVNRGQIDVYDAGGRPRGVSIQIPGRDAGFTTGCYFNPESQTLFATTFSGRSVHEFDGTTPVRRIDVAALGAGVVAVESLAFLSGGNRFFVAMPYSAPQLASYAFSAASGASDPHTYTVPAGVGRTEARVDWIDVAEENGDVVVYYTDESARPAGNTSHVYRYVPSTGARTVFANIPEGKAYALRLLPAGSGLLVAGYSHIYRFNMQGQEVFRYYGVGPDEGAFFALNITPDGRHFWTATSDSSRPGASGRLHKFNTTASRHPILSVTTGAPAVSGLCLKLEYTAARNVCTDPATGQTIACPRLEVCNEGPDDDGDGLIDVSDPDCVLNGAVANPGDRAPVCDAAMASIPMILWPPNSKLAEVTVVGVVDPDGDPITIRVDGIQQDEPTSTAGGGNTDVDGAISADRRTAFVRAEREGTASAPGDGRVYEILFTATTPTLSCSSVVRVGVPFNRRTLLPPVRSPGTYNSLTGARID